MPAIFSVITGHNNSRCNCWILYADEGLNADSQASRIRTAILGRVAVFEVWSSPDFLKTSLVLVSRVRLHGG